MPPTCGLRRWTLLGKTPSLREELAEAETKLTEAVKAWRLAGRRESGYV